MSGCVLILVWIGCVLVGAAAGYAVGYLGVETRIRADRQCYCACRCGSRGNPGLFRVPQLAGESQPVSSTSASMFVA